MNTLTGEILTLPKMSGSVSTPNSLSGNVGAKTINIGGKGDDGATFIPSVSADGVISWTNDKDLPNPEPVNIKGAKGDKGEKGDKGDRGLQGVQGIQGERGEQGQKGDKGDRGEDYVLTSEDIDAIAQQAAQLVDIPEDLGDAFVIHQTETGIDKTNTEIYEAYLQNRPMYGVVHNVSNNILHPIVIDETFASFCLFYKKKSYVITYTNNNLTVEEFEFATIDQLDGLMSSSELTTAINTALSQAKESGEFDGQDGKNGIDGKDGQDGYTPIKGKDYFTELDKAEMVQSVIDSLPVYNGEVIAV